MKKKYRSLVLVPVILLCTLFGCRKEKAELLFEDTEKIIEEDPADLSGDSEENQKAGRSVESGELMLENSDRNTLEESDTGKVGTTGEYAGTFEQVYLQIQVWVSMVQGCWKKRKRRCP